MSQVSMRKNGAAAAVGAGIVCAGFAATQAHGGEWTATILHPAAASNSQAFAGEGTQIAGLVENQAVVFDVGGGFTTLSPIGAATSVCYALHNGQQVGTALIDDAVRASLWSGNAGSWVDLHPVVATQSRCLDIHNGQQVGWATVGGVNEASLWSGTAASRVNLHPSGAASSTAEAIHANLQVGYASIGGVQSAGFWQNTAASWQLLTINPIGVSSFALGTDGSQIVGAVVTSGAKHATLWPSATQWVDLHPAEAAYSEALDAFGGYQVGYMFSECLSTRASIWNGDASTWVDLHVALPNTSTWGTSVADGVWIDGNMLYVAGWATNMSAGGSLQAVLWKRELVEQLPCPADTNEDMVVNVSDLLAVINSWGACPVAGAAAGGDAAAHHDHEAVFLKSVKESQSQ